MYLEEARANNVSSLMIVVCEIDPREKLTSRIIIPVTMEMAISTFFCKYGQYVRENRSIRKRSTK